MTANAATQPAPPSGPAPSAPNTLAKAKSPLTLAIDIGGTGLKAMLLDPKGNPVSERQRVETPEVPTPKTVLAALDKLVKLLPGYDRISAGFPGVIKKGVVYTAVNLNPEWVNFPLADEMTRDRKSVV